MHHPPVLPYCGLTIILSHASRFDTTSLLSGYVGDFVAESIKPISRYACDIRLTSDSRSLLPATKVVVLLGSLCLGRINKAGENLDNLRGGCYSIGDIIYIPSYFPQDAFDRKNYESTLNPNAPQSDEEEEADDEDEGSVKDRGRTARRNFRFWLRKDLEKAVSVLKNGYHPNICEYKLRPNADEVIKWMDSLKDQYVYFDIETEISTGQITCFGISTDAKVVYTVSIIQYNWTLFHDRVTTARIFRSLCGVFNRNTIVIHNALFDLFILVWKYKIPPPKKIHCTMNMWYRIFPDTEKSLGHVISAATHELYHKGENIHNPVNQKEETQALLYNAKDVERLALCHAWLLSVAAKRSATGSCEQVNSSLRLYLTMMYRGLRIDNDLLCKEIDELERRIGFFEARVLPKLIGHHLNPRSAQKVAVYLYEEVGLPKPKGFNVSLTGKITLYKLLLKNDFPSLRVILACRKWSKEKGTLGFRHWLRDGVVTCAYKLTTKSFRLSSSTLLRQKNRKDTGWGTNLQNWNKKLRKLVIPFNDP